MALFIDNNLLKKILKASAKVLENSSNTDTSYIHIFTENSILYVHAINYNTDLYLPICEYDYTIDVIVDFKKLSNSIALMEDKLVIKESNDNVNLIVADSKARIKLHKYSQNDYTAIANRQEKITNVVENGETIQKENFSKITSYLSQCIPKSFSESLMDSLFYNETKAYIYANQYIVRMDLPTQQQFVLEKSTATILQLISDTYTTNEFSLLKSTNKLEVVIDNCYFVINEMNESLKSIASISDIFNGEITIHWKYDDILRFAKLATVFIDKDDDSELLIYVEDNKCFVTSDTDLDLSNCVINLTQPTDDCKFTVNAKDFLKVITGLKSFGIVDLSFELDLNNDCGRLVHSLGDIFISIMEN